MNGLLIVIVGVNAVGLLGLWLTIRARRKAKLRAETEALIARAVRARDPMHGKEIPPLKMTLAEMRAEAERRDGRS